MKAIKYSLLVAILLILLVTPVLPNYPGNVVNAAVDCTSSSPASNAYTVTVCFSTPANNSTLHGAVTVTATVSVTGTNPGTQRMVFYLNSVYLLTDFQTSYTFSLPTTKWVDGSYTLEVEALMRDGFTSARATQTEIFANGITTPPVNNNTFTPTSGTNPGAGAPLVVVASGDGASGEANATSVTNLIATLNPNLFLYLGDVYEKGAPTEFYNWYGLQGFNYGRFRSITNPTIGNHEYSASTAALGYFDYWNNVPNYYSFNAGGWHFISLNSNSARIGVSSTSAQYAWLQQDLTANSLPCTIVYYHHPYFNIGPEGPKTVMVDIWKLMAQHNVTMVLNGHDHDYQRWKALDANGNLSSTGITEFVAGGGGHGVQTIATTDSRVAYSNSSNPAALGALRLSLSSSGASFSYRSINGSTLDSGTVPCSGAGPDTQPPSVPAGLAATPQATSVSLSWQAASDNVGVTGYTIYRNGAALNTVSGSTLSYVDNTVSPQTNYSYRVDAFDAAGNHSAQSSPVAVTTEALPASLTFFPDSDAYVNAGSPTTKFGTATTLRADASPDLHSYLRFTVQGLAGTPVVSARLRLNSSNTSSIGIRALRVADNTWSESTLTYSNAPALGSLIGTSGAITAGTWATMDVTSYVTGEGVYSFGVNTTSASALSFASRETGANAPQLIIDFQGGGGGDTQPPSTPGGLTASAASPTQVNLAWQAATDNVGVTGYTIYRDGAALNTVGGGTLSYQDTTVSAQTTYSYTVDAFDQAGNHSSQSAPAPVTTPAGSDTQPPSTPGGLTATSPSSTQVNLAWQASTDNVGVSGYTIYRDGAALNTVGGGTLSYQDTTVSAQTSYSYTVDAFDQAGNHSPQSAPAPVTTGGGQPPTSLTFTPVADTYVNAGSVTTNYGSLTTLRADASPDVHSYLRFNVQGLAGSSVASARLRIFANSSSSQGISALAVADNTWVEGTVNYNNAPALGSSLASSAAVATATWVELTVTPYITADGTYNFAITTPGATAISLAARKSGANAPQLIVDLQ